MIFPWFPSDMPLPGSVRAERASLVENPPLPGSPKKGFSSAAPEVRIGQVLEKTEKYLGDFLGDGDTQLSKILMILVLKAMVTTVDPTH